MDCQHFYIPVSSLNFTNFLSSDSISPASYYAERGYGFRRFEPLISNPLPNATLAYSSPIFHKLREGTNEEYVFNLRVEKSKLEGASSIQQKSLEILSFSRTLHVTPKSCRLVFKNSEQRSRIFALALKSLEAKFAEYYRETSIVAADIDAPNIIWNESLIAELSNPEKDDRNIKLDRRINKAKGVVYGISAGILNSVSPEATKAETLIKEFFNEFSSTINQLSALRSDSAPHSLSAKSLEPRVRHLNELVDSIAILTSALDDVTKDDVILDNLTGSSQHYLTSSKEMRFPGVEVTPYHLIWDYMRTHWPEKLPISDILKELIHQLQYVIRYKSPSDYNNLREAYGSHRHQLLERLRSIATAESNDDQLQEIPIEFASDGKLREVRILDYDKPTLLMLATAINSILISDEVSTSDEIGMARKNIITHLGAQIKQSLGQDHDDVIFLRSLFTSLDTIGSGFKPGSSKNPVLKTLAVFMQKYSELDKFKGHLDKNNLNKRDVAFAFWGGAYGYSNMSKLFMEPISQNKSAAMKAFDFCEQNLLSVVNSNGLSEGSEKNVKNAKTTEASRVKTLNFSDLPPPLSDDPNQNFISDFAFTELEDLLRGDEKFGEWQVTCLKDARKVALDSSETFVKCFHSKLRSKGKPKGFGPAKADLAFKKVLQFLEKEIEVTKTIAPNEEGAEPDLFSQMD